MKLYILLFTAFILGCHEQKKGSDSSITTINKVSSIINEDTIMINKENVKIEYYDFQVTQNGTRSVSYERSGGWLVEIWAMKQSSFGECVEYAPANDFYEIQKSFYPNGLIKERGMFISNVGFGRREYFDVAGNCIKIVDEDKKIGKIKKEDILLFLEKEGWFNRQTGENIITEKPVLPTDYTFYREITKYLKITFKRSVEDQFGNELEPPKWFIEIDPRSKMYITRYIIDGNTGKFEKKETYEPLEI